MTRKLVALNLVLAALVGAAAYQLRENWLAARAREQALARKKVAPVPAPPVPAPVPIAPVEAASYIDVAQNMLFSKDRNPNVVVPVEVIPEKPVPPFPEAHGVMDLGAGPTVILSEKAGGPQKGYRQGDKVGPFQISRLTNAEIVLAWEEKEFPKQIADLKVKPKAEGGAPDTAQARQTPPPKHGVWHEPTSEEKAKEAVEALKPRDGTPGIDTGGVERNCVPGDTAPNGAIMGGYRKIVTPSPFGQSCRWVPIR